MDNELKSAIKKASNWDELSQLMASVDAQELQSRDYSVLHRALQKCEKASDIKIAYLGDHTLDLLPKYVEVLSALSNIRSTSFTGSFDQYFQEVLDTNSSLHEFNPDIIFLSVTPRRVSGDIFGRFLELSTEEKKQEQQRILSYINEWATAAKQLTGATLVISNFSRPGQYQAGIADAKLDYSEAEWYGEFNMALQCQFKQDPRVHIFDLDQVTSRYGCDKVYDAKMFYLAKMEWTEAFLPVLAERMLRYIIALKGLTKKCLVVDLDNTLWGGVVGEDGVNNVSVGKGYTEGEVFYDFQRVIRSLKSRGIILAICSKNNPEDAKEVFDTRADDMPLKLDDFAAQKINWNHKHSNIQEIAAALNIGTDSLVFVDDNPVERELIHETMPEVKTIDIPADTTSYLTTFYKFPYFEKLSITSEDTSKADQYIDNAKRAELKEQAGDINSFLESLETVLTLEVATEVHIPRVHQLFSKTNQFNVTTKRYSIPEVETFIAESDWDLHIASVKDKFGDLGIIGLYLVKNNTTTCAIDSFILSCRAMGRGIETAMMNSIKRDHLLNGDATELNANYLPTAKNKPVLEFYDKQGFNLNSENEAGEKAYTLEAATTKLNEHPGITIKLNEES